MVNHNKIAWIGLGCAVAALLLLALAYLGPQIKVISVQAIRLTPVPDSKEYAVDFMLFDSVKGDENFHPIQGDFTELFLANRKPGMTQTLPPGSYQLEYQGEKMDFSFSITGEEVSTYDLTDETVQAPTPVAALSWLFPAKSISFTKDIPVGEWVCLKLKSEKNSVILAFLPFLSDYPLQTRMGLTALLVAGWFVYRLKRTKPER